MAHFAKLNSDNIVVQRALVDNSFMLDDDGVEQESYGINRLNKLYGDISPSYWKQYSVNTYEGKHYNPDTDELSPDQSKSFRKNAAGIGTTYDADRDAFIYPKADASWVLDETSCVYLPPIALPTDAAFIAISREETLKWRNNPEFNATYVAFWDEDNTRFVGVQGSPGANLSNPTHTWNGTAWVAL